MYDQWILRGAELLNRVLNGEDYRKLPRYGNLYADDPADIAAASVNQKLKSQHETWLSKLASKPH